MSGLTGIRACVFDAYGTIFDFASAAERCPDIPDEKRGALTTLWRDEQLQYTWLRTLQKRYVDFWQVTGDALDFTLDSLGLDEPGLHARLMDLYLTLSAFPEVAQTHAETARCWIPHGDLVQRHASDVGNGSARRGAGRLVRRSALGRYSWHL